MHADRGPADAVHLDDLTVVYAASGPSPQHVALNGISVDVPYGKVLGVLGDTGSGKSTLARVLTGATYGKGRSASRPRIVGGDAVVVGRRIRRMDKRSVNRLTFDVGYLAQDAATTLRPDFVVADLVAEPIYSRDRHYDSHKANTRVAALLDAVHLPLGILNRYPSELSGGQRQRVAFARALVLGPKLLVADEPTAGVDLTVRDAVVELVVELKRAGDFSAVVVSHDLAVLRRVTDQIVVLHAGRPVAIGSIDEVLAELHHPYLAGLAHALGNSDAPGNPKAIGEAPG